MRKARLIILAVLLVTLMMFVSAAEVQVPVVAEASQRDVVTLNATAFNNWPVGKAGKFTVRVNGTIVDRTTMTWKSSNEKVATCEDGHLVAVGGGTAVITCTKENGTVAECTVTVKDVVTLNTSEIKGWTVGKEADFAAYMNGKRVSNSNMTWKSNNTAVATCVGGRLKATGAGTTTITCTKENGTVAKCTVTVKGPDVVTLNTSVIKGWTVGKEADFVAYVNGKRVSNSTMTWKSSNEAVATCVSGHLVAKGAGTAVITCTKTNGTTASCTVTVKGKDVVTLNTSEIKNWTVGKEGDFAAYVNGKRVNNSIMTWKSSNATVATCVGGHLVAKGAGTATITCTKTNGTTAQCTVTVKGQDIVTLNTNEIKNWTVGKEGDFAAYVNGKRVSNSTMTWKSDNTDVATCVGGHLIAVGGGTATITCTKANGTTTTCTVTVKDKVTLDAEEITDWKVGQKGIFTAYVNGKTVALTTLEWSSSNPAVATCENGRLVGVSVGTAVISCTKENGTVAKCRVTVKDFDKVTLNVETLSDWWVGRTGTFTAYVNGQKVASETMTWTSSNPSVATCENGYLVGVKTGTTVISCTKDDGMVAQCTVTVKDKVALNTSSLPNWKVGQGANFAAYVNGKQVALDTMDWFSSNPSVATCKNGYLFGVSAGTTMISCTKANGTVATCAVTIKAQEQAKDVVTFAGSASQKVFMEAGERINFIMLVNGKKVENDTLIWKSSDPSVATCENGCLVAIGAGTATVTCTKENGTTATCTVTVKASQTVPTHELFYCNLKEDGTIRLVRIKDIHVTAVTIPDYIDGRKVTEIAAGALSGLQELVEVEIPDTITLIGNNAMANCKKLKSVFIPGSVQTISSMAFVNCSELEDVFVEEGVKEIGNNVFLNCRSLIDVSLPDSLNSIGNGIFFNCQNLERVTMPEAMLRIPDAMFNGCGSLKNITIPKDVRNIGVTAFLGCRSLESIELPNTLVGIGARAFANCQNLKKVVLPDSVMSIGENAFSYCDAMTSIKIPNNAVSIGTGAFSCSGRLMEFEVDSDNRYFELVDGVLYDKGKTKLISMPRKVATAGYTVPEGVVELCGGAFSGCGVKEVILPSSLLYIGERAFERSGITTLFIPDNVETLEPGALSDMYCLEEIKVGNNNKNYTAVNNVLFNKNMTTLFQMPISRQGDYIIPYGVTTIEKSAFSFSKLNSVVIPNSVRIIGESAFEYCEAKEEFVIPQSVIGIADYAFWGVTGFENLVLPSNLTTIGDSAFMECYDMKTVTIPKSVTGIGPNAFEYDVTIITQKGSYADGYAAEYGYTVQYQ